MTQAETKHIEASSSRGFLTSEDHRLKIGHVELRIPKGTRVDDCLEDVSLFVGVAEEALAELLADASGNELFPVSTLRCVQYNLGLAAMMASAAHRTLLTAGRLDAIAAVRAA